MVLTRNASLKSTSRRANCVPLPTAPTTLRTKLRGRLVLPDTLPSVDHLPNASDNYRAKQNREPKPFIWTAKAAEIIEKAKRARK